MDALEIGSKCVHVGICYVRFQSAGASDPASPRMEHKHNGKAQRRNLSL